MSDISTQPPVETGESAVLLQAMHDLTTLVENMRGEVQELKQRLDRAESAVARVELAGLKSMDLPR